MTGFKYEPRLHGWDDEKVYFIDEAGVEWCVSDYADLVARLVEICHDYFAQKSGRPKRTGGGSDAGRRLSGC